MLGRAEKSIRNALYWTRAIKALVLKGGIQGRDAPLLVKYVEAADEAATRALKELP